MVKREIHNFKLMGSNPFSVIFFILGSYSLTVKHITVTCVMWVQIPLATHTKKEGVAKWLKALVLKTNGLYVLRGFESLPLRCVAHNSVVEEISHKNYVVGSNPAGPTVKKFSIKC
jgi:hypothetical protein